MKHFGVNSGFGVCFDFISDIFIKKVFVVIFDVIVTVGITINITIILSLITETFLSY